MTYAAPALRMTLGLGLCAAAQADILFQNSLTNAGNAAAEAAWLADIGISAAEVAHFVDFENGLSLGQNVSGVSGLFPGGLVIVDSSAAGAATVQTSSAFFGGSNPVGMFAIAHNELPWLELDFSAQPVDYVALNDIDQAGMLVVVHFVDGTTSQFNIETTAVSGDSAEFVGIFRNDRPPIARVQFDASGAPGWGIDNIKYGPTIGTAYCSAVANSTGVSGVLTASGSRIASTNSVQLVAHDLPTNQFGYFLNSLTQGFVPGPGASQGNLCLAGGIGRYNGPGLILNTGTIGLIALELDLTGTPTPSGPTSVVTGQTWHFQCWYRDLNPMATSNFTQGLSISFL